MQYQERIIALEQELKQRKSRKNIIGFARLLVLCFAIAAAYQVYPHGLQWAALAILIPGAVFLRLIIISANLQQQIRILENMLELNREELRIAQHLYTDRRDGKEFTPALHDYSHDLDILGRASLFQYTQRTTSEQGDKTLVNWLLEPASTKVIRERQTAVKELAPLLPWRQEFQAKGMLNRITVSTEEKISTFVSDPESAFTSGVWRAIRIGAPAIMLTLLVLNSFDIVSNAVFYPAIFIALLFSGYISKKAMPVYMKLNKISGEMEALTAQLQHIEKQAFRSDYLQRTHEATYTNHHPASQSIRKFRQILDKMDLRLNPLVFIPLNIFLFWDLQQLFALEAWKKEHQGKINAWFTAIGEIEALQSFAALHQNHPDWCFPEITAEHGTFRAASLGHPLIPASKRIDNEFATQGTPHVSLVTGSNMAGKSTFLRSTGINTVLAMAGAPVCAASLTISNMRIMSSMRIADNLEESTSTFYAELKKLKNIIEAVKRHEPVFLLLDEILRGTNSLDRHTGSAALIHQLIREDAVAIIATHDLELAKISGSYPIEMSNYHFDVQVDGEELYFDYKLKDGVCSSLNASILMKKIGIDM